MTWESVQVLLTKSRRQDREANSKLFDVSWSWSRTCLTCPGPGLYGGQRWNHPLRTNHENHRSHPPSLLKGLWIHLLTLHGLCRSGSVSSTTELIKHLEWQEEKLWLETGIWRPAVRLKLWANTERRLRSWRSLSTAGRRREHQVQVNTSTQPKDCVYSADSAGPGPGSADCFVLTWLKSSSMEPLWWASSFWKISEEEDGSHVTVLLTIGCTSLLNIWFHSLGDDSQG